MGVGLVVAWGVVACLGAFSFVEFLSVGRVPVDLQAAVSSLSTLSGR